MAESASGPVSSLYVHVPFCARKCAYCAFYSEPSPGELVNRYVNALTRELEMIADDLRPRTVFFGGGTPSLLNPRQWEQILKAMDHLGLLGAAEWTVECNPATVSLDKARLLRSYGINRMSMGVQSLNRDLLERLGRVHTREMVFKSYDILRRAEFDDVNLDLMFAIPTQNLEVWRETLREAIAMGSDHLSTYEVIYEEDTPLYEQLQAGKVAEDEDLACAMYDELVTTAAHAGFHQYEVANFAKSGRDAVLSVPIFNPTTPAHPVTPAPTAAIGFPLPQSQLSTLNSQLLPTRACLHNVNYWRGRSFYGAGPSATTYIRGVRAKNWSNTQLYCEQIESGRRAIESREELTPLARAGETAAFGLRMTSGWPFDEFHDITGFDLRKQWADDMRQLADKGWAVIEPGCFRLTPEGLRFADSAAQQFLR